MNTFLLDLRAAARTLARNRGFTAVVAVTLALGIAANTTMFTVVNDVVLRPLPYRNAERVAVIWNDLGNGAQSLPAVHPLDYRDYQDKSLLFEDFAAASGARIVGLTGVLTGDDEPERIDLCPVTANFFPLLGVDPFLGSHFDPEDEALNGPEVAMISYQLWQRRYGGDPEIVGKTIRIDGIQHRVVGVLPADFRLHLPAEAFMLKHSDVWTLLQVDYSDMPPRNLTYFSVFGLLRSGVTWAQAQAEMEAIAADLRAAWPVHAASNLRIRVVPLHDDVVKGVRPALTALAGAVGFLLLIVCANLASLLLVRGVARGREVAIQAALGAGRGRIARRLFSESLLLAGLGAVLGLAFTYLALGALASLPGAGLPRLESVHVDSTVIGFTAVMALLTSVLFGLLPAFKGTDLDLAAVLRESGRTSGGKDVQRLRGLFVIGEISLALVLLIGVGLLIRSFSALQHVRPGFDPEGVMTFRLDLPASHYPDAQVRQVFWDELRDALQALPGVRSVGAISPQLPLTGSGSLAPYAYDEETATNWESVTADGRWIDPTYFGAMGIRMISGRGFTDPEDEPDASPVIVIDELLARRVWGGENPVGQLLQVNPSDADQPFARIVGVAEHVRNHDLARQVREQIYKPIASLSLNYRSWVVRTEGDPVRLAQPIRDLVAGLDPGLPVSELRPLTSYVAAAADKARFSLLLMTVFGALALLLAALGISSVIAYAVSQRRRELAIRLALGDEPGGLVRRILGQGLGLVAVSTAVGFLASFVLTRFLGEMLYGVTPTDPATWLAAGAFLAAVALAASYFPARHAAKIEPSSVLRSE